MAGLFARLATTLLACWIGLTAASAGELELKLEARIAAELERTIGTHSSELLSIQRFYADRAFAPIWVAEAEAGPRAQAAHAVIQSAVFDGLDPREYGSRAIEGRLIARTHGELADLEFLLSRALVNLGGDIATGRVQPRSVDPELHLAPKRIEPLLVLSNAAAATDLPAFLRSLAPATPEYGRLKAALAEYRAVAERGGWTSVPSGVKLEPGARDERVRKLRARLVETGDVIGSGADPLVYDDALVSGVKRFQLRHGLADDGIVAAGTLTQLNVPVERRIEQMLLNMERRRWMPVELGDRYVFVNLADFTLKVVDAGRTVHDTRVVVGKPFFRTPVFSGMMTYIVLNPYWHIPASIATAEILPKLRRNPGYAASQNIRVLTRGGDEVNPHSVDWSSLGAGSFPYRLRQDAGEKNSLGRIKFMFPNQFNVYLHDTPSRDLFQRSVRSFSHGCVRVYKPLELAEILLRDDPDWSRARMDAVLARGQQSIINLERPIPVHLTYLTAWVNKDSSVNFRDDVYGRDKRLEKALKADREEGFDARL